MSVSPIIKPPFYQSLLNPTHPLARNLILKWMMNEETGDGLFDITRNGNNGTIVGATWGRGGLTFDGGNDLVTRARLTGLTNWTVCIRGYVPEDVTGIKNPILDQGGILIKQRDDDIIYGATSDLEIDYTSMVTACLAAGSSVDILVTRDGTTMVCYVYDTNGELYTDTFVVAGTANTSRTNLILGSQSRTAFLYPAMRPANMTGEKSLLINASDDIQIAKGFRSLNSDVVTECWNANQKSILIWIDPLNFTPGNGYSYYLFENRGTSTLVNREICSISTDGLLTYFIRDKDGDSHSVSVDVTGWAIGDRHQIFLTLDFAADAMALYVDGALADDAGHGLSNDSIDEIEATVHVGSGVNIFQINSGITIQVFNRIWSLAEITANYDSGDGTPFVVTPDTILMARYSEEDNGIVFHHSGMFVTESDSAGDLTDVTGCETRFTVDDAVNFYGGCGEAITGPCIVLTSAGTRVRVHSGTAFADISSGQKFYRSDADFPESGITGANDLTIQGWIFLPNITGLKFFVTKWGAAGDRMYNFGILGDVLYFAVSDDGTDGYYNYSSSTIEANRWFHVAIVYTAAAGTVDFYINGHFTNQGDTVDHSIADKAPPFTIGTWSGDTSNYTGGFFNIALFDDKRTAAEILASANDWDIDLSAEGNLIGNWMFDEDADVAAIDNTEGDAGRDLIPWDDGDVTFSGLRSVVGGYVQDVEKVGVSIDCDTTHSATAANNTIHNIGLQDFGIWVWVKANSDAADATQGIVTKSINNPRWRFVIQDGVILLVLTDGDNDSYAIKGNTDIRDDTWHFVAAIIDRINAGNCKIYLDGVEDGTTDKTGTIGDIGTLANTAKFTVGAYDDEVFFFDGFIAEVGIVYPADIMAAGEMGAAGEILALATNPHNPVAWPNSEDYWLLDENTGTTLTGQNNNLTLSNAAAWDQRAHVSKNHLLPDENGGIGGVSNIDTTWTVSKDTTVKFMDSRSLKGVCAAGDDGDEFTIWSPTLVTDENYFQTIQVWIPTIHDDTTLLVDVDGVATPITSIEVGKSLSHDGHFARNFNLDGTYRLDGGNIHNVGVNDFNLSMWVTNSSTDYAYCIRKGTGSVGSYGYGMAIENGKLYGVLIDSGGRSSITQRGSGLNDGKWHHIALTFDRDGVVTLYADGVSLGTTDISGTAGSLDAVNNFRLGQTVQPWDGSIADAKIYIGGLWTAGEVLDLYNNPFDLSVVAGKLTDAWFCDDNAANTIVVSQAGGTNLVASANTDVFAEKHWKMYNFCWKADQTDIIVNMRATGAGAGANEVEVNVDAGQLRVNMVANGGCEGGADPPADWTQETNATVVSDTSPHSGTNCLKVTASAANVGASQSITLVEGRSYTVTVYAKVTTGDTAALVVDKGDGTIVTLDSTTSTTWVMLQGTFVATGANGEIYLRGVVSGDIVWFDDASMLINDYADAETDDRIRDFAGGRIDGLEIHNAAIPAVGIKRLRDLPHEMLL